MAFDKLTLVVLRLPLHIFKMVPHPPINRHFVSVSETLSQMSTMISSVLQGVTKQNIGT